MSMESSPAVQKGAPLIQKGDSAPDSLGVSLEGHQIHLSDSKGKVVVLVFWKTWCLSCRNELIAMKTLLHEYRNRLVLIAVNIGESREDVRAFKRHFLLDFPVSLDPAARVASAYGIRVWPTTILIDRHGLVYWTSTGSDVESLRQKADMLLAEEK
jgi:peroxiredoxin